MNVEITVQEALRILRGNQAGIGKRHSRSHDEARVDNVNRIRALEGICGSCDNLRLTTESGFVGRQIVHVRCRAGYSPREVYQNTDLGQIATCLALVNLPLTNVKKFQ